MSKPQRAAFSCRLDCYPVPVAAVPKTCCVSFNVPAGQYVHITARTSAFQAASRALAFFRSSTWHGPQPGRDTVLEIALVGGRAFQVRCGRVIKWRKDGHGQISTTMDLYSHVMPGMVREAMRTMDGLLKPVGSVQGAKQTSGNDTESVTD